MEILSARGSRVPTGRIAPAALRWCGATLPTLGLSMLFAVAIARGLFLPAVLVLAISLYVLVFAARPGAAVLLYAATRPVVDSFVHFQVGPLSAGEVWGGGLIAVCVVYLAFVPDRTRERPTAVLGGFLIVYAALTFWRPHYSVALSLGLKLASWLLLVIAVERVSQTSAGQRAAFRAGCAGAILVLIAIAYAAARHRYGSAYYAVEFSHAPDQFSSPGQAPVGLTEFAVMALPFVLYAGLGRGHRTFWNLSAGALGVAIVLSFVRTTFLGLAVVLIGYAALVLRRRSARPAVFATLVPVLGATLATVYLLGSKIAMRFSDLLYLTHGGPDKELAGSGRLYLWLKLFHAGWHSLTSTLIGRGAGASIDLTINDHLNKNGPGGVWSHNDLLEAFVTGGLLLAFAYLFLLAWVVRSAWGLVRDRRQTHAARDLGIVCLIAFAAFSVMSFASGIAFSSVATIEMAILLGLVRGMRATPGETFADAVSTRPTTPLSSTMLPTRHFAAESEL
jgi:hypothetical protein